VTAVETEAVARRAYTGLWRVLVDWFRVPEEPPALPVQPGETLESFRPADGFLRYLKLWFWIVAVVIDVALLVAWIVITVRLWWLGLILLPPFLVLAIVPDVIGYVAVHLRFDTTWYAMTERSIRIRRGIWIIHEMTITFENVQNVKVTQGPLQRYFGVSDVVLETAGGGGGGGGGGSSGGLGVANRGVIEGIADPQRLRDVILARLRRSRSAGLGDEETETSARGLAPAHLRVLREIRDEVAALAS
jgi:membrane protein YdbS with pleckstrin-like domain